MAQNDNRVGLSVDTEVFLYKIRSWEAIVVNTDDNISLGFLDASIPSNGNAINVIGQPRSYD